MPKKFFTIGKVPGYNKIINKTYSYDDKLLPHLAFVDLFPRTLKYNTGIKYNDVNQLKTFINDIFTYADADHPMKWFNKVMQNHKDYIDSYNPAAGYDGIRLVATVDSAVNNSISHTYDTNVLDHTANGFKSMFTSLLGAAVGKVTKGKVNGDAVDKGLNSAAKVSTALKMMSGNQYDANSHLSEVSAMLNSFSGYRIHMPKMWTGSSVQDILQLSVKLTSPSGDMNSIKRYIIEPLIVIFIMSSPLSVTGTDIGTPFIYEVDAHGMGHYKLAGITNVNFDRGGTDVDFNIYQQPLTVNVRLTLQPLAQDALTAMGEPTFYDNAWFQTPASLVKSLEPKTDIANVVENIYKKGY